MAGEQDIGLRIRSRRNELGLTIRELGRRANLSASFISQVERNKTNISLDSLRTIAEKLDIPIHYFFAEESSGSYYSEAAAPCQDDPGLVEDYTPVVRAGCRPRLYLPDSGVNYELLTKDLTNTMEPILGRLSPGTENVARRLRKPTEEFIFVLLGKLLIVLGDKEHTLNPGDSIYFQGFDLQKIACASEQEDVVWLSVITPPVF